MDANPGSVAENPKNSNASWYILRLLARSSRRRLTPEIKFADCWNRKQLYLDFWVSKIFGFKVSYSAWPCQWAEKLSTTTSTETGNQIAETGSRSHLIEFTICMTCLTSSAYSSSVGATSKPTVDGQAMYDGFNGRDMRIIVDKWDVVWWLCSFVKLRNHRNNTVACGLLMTWDQLISLTYFADKICLSFEKYCTSFQQASVIWFVIELQPAIDL